VYRVWSHETDVLFVGSWTGEHRDLLRVVLPHEKVLDVLPGLARGDNLEEALAAMYMAAVDLGAAGELDDSSSSQIRHALLQHAQFDYSIPKNKPAAERAAESVAAPLTQLDADQRKRLTGPVWRARGDLRENRRSAWAIAADESFLVTSDGAVVVAIDP
jgi:hypothetical protein